MVVPAIALAAGSWPWPVEGPVVTPFGAFYEAGGVRCSHGGVDIGAEAGTGVDACSAGTVSFAGPVPAGPGRRAYAVTVTDAAGLKVTYLPLARASVRAGERVAPGEEIGILAGAGDASSAAPHLHLGVRRGQRQIDPLPLLSGGAAGDPSAAPTAPSPSGPKGPGATGPGLPVPARTPVPARAFMPAAPVPTPARAVMTPRSSGGALSATQMQTLRAAVSTSAHASAGDRRAAVRSVPEGVLGARVRSAAAYLTDARSAGAAVIVRVMLVCAAGLLARPLLRTLRPARPAAVRFAGARVRHGDR